MGLVVQILVTGIGIGLVYGLLAVCLSLIYRLTGVIHFALGEIATLAAFATILVVFGVGVTAASQTSIVRFVVGGVVALALAGVASLLIYVVGVRPFLRGDSVMGWVAGTLAGAVVLRGLVHATFTGPSYRFPDPTSLSGAIDLGGGAGLEVRVLFIAGAASLIAAAALLLQRSRWGRAMTAITEDRIGAALVGIPIERSLLLAFAATGVIAGLVALIVFMGSAITIDTGTLVAVKALAAATIAGFRLPRPAFVAGIGVGIVETALSNVRIGELSSAAATGEVVVLAAAVVLLGVRAWAAVQRGAPA